MALNTLYLYFRFEMDNTVVTDYKIFCDGDIMLPIGIRYYCTLQRKSHLYIPFL
jgi:hypothetical protein